MIQDVPYRMATSLNYVPLCFSRRHKNVISLIFLVSNVFQKKIWTNTEKVCHKTIQKQEAHRATYHAPEYNVPIFLGNPPGQPSCFSDRPKNTNLAEEVEIHVLLPVKFHWIPFSHFRGEVEKMSQPIRGQDGHLIFLIGPKNTKG